MDDTKNFLLDLMQTAKERFGNPLVTAFILSWIVWNFRLLLVFFGSGEGGWQAKITYIDTRLMPNWFDWLLHGLILPLISALLWIYVFPPILRIVALYHQRSQHATRVFIFRGSRTKTLSNDEALHLRTTMASQRAKWQKEKAESALALEEYISTQKQTSEALQKEKEESAKKLTQITELETQIEELRDPLPEKFDFHNKSTQEKSAALGLNLQDTAVRTSSPHQVLFDNKSISWPWDPKKHQKSKIAYQQLVKHPASEDVIGILLHLESDYIPNTETKKADWIEIFSAAGFAKPNELYRYAIIHGILAGDFDRIIFTKSAAVQAVWLKDLGFELVKY